MGFSFRVQGFGFAGFFNRRSALRNIPLSFGGGGGI